MRWGGRRREEDVGRKEGMAIFTQWEKTDLRILGIFTREAIFYITFK